MLILIGRTLKEIPLFIIQHCGININLQDIFLIKELIQMSNVKITILQFI